MKRDQRIAVNLNLEERGRLESVAVDSGLRLGEFLRVSAMGVPYRIGRLRETCDQIRKLSIYAVRNRISRTRMVGLFQEIDALVADAIKQERRL